MKKRLFINLFLFAAFLFGNFSALMSQMSLNLPPHASVYNYNVRGYWFTAPTDFVITGLRVPSDAGPGLQNIQVIKITGAPVEYSAAGTNFTTLSYIKGAPNGVIQVVNIPVSAGDQIGVFGEAGVNVSYSGSLTPFSSAIFGMPVALGRLIYQGNIGVNSAPNYSVEASGQLGRVEFYYMCKSPNADNVVANQVAPCVFNFNLTNVQNTNTVKWDFGDGSPIATGSSTAHAYSTNDSFVVKAKLYNGCDSTTILKAVTCSTTGIELIEFKEEINFYPNPASSQVSIEVEKDFNLKEIIIYNLLGQKLYQVDAEETQQHVIDVTSFSTGIYSVYIQTNKGLLIRKLEVER